MKCPRELRIVSGVYMLSWQQFNSDTIQREVVYYIGQADNILHRYEQHRRRFFGQAQHMTMPRCVVLREVESRPTKENLLDAERRFIFASGNLGLTLMNTFRPVRDRCNPPDLTSEIDCLRGALAILNDPEDPWIEDPNEDEEDLDFQADPAQ